MQTVLANIMDSKNNGKQTISMTSKQIGRLLIALGAIALASSQAMALSLISEKCDPNKVGPDETTVKGGWQAEMFNGLSFRTCGK